MSLAETVIAGVPQGSIDGLWYLFVNDLILFLFMPIFSNNADDNNLYTINKDKEARKNIVLENF